MALQVVPSITIYVRHSADCKYVGDEFKRRCKCRKHLRWTQDGVRKRVKAGTRSWDEAERVKRSLEETFLHGASGASSEAVTSPSLDKAISLFVQDKTVQGIKGGTLEKYHRELQRLRIHCERLGVYMVSGISGEMLISYAASWDKFYPSTQTRGAVKSRLSGFLRFCYEMRWLTRIPKLPKIKVDVVPTLPLSPDEYQRLVSACETVPLPVPASHALAVVQLMRWSGLAIGDALRLPKSHIVASEKLTRVVTARQKTGTDVSVILHPDAAKAVAAVESNNEYLFWDGKSDIVKSWTKYVIAPLFEAARIDQAGGSMKSHRLRDTFACELLAKGVPLEDVSKMLGHESIKTTERSYAKWVKGRQDRLDDLLLATF